MGKLVLTIVCCVLLLSCSFGQGDKTAASNETKKTTAANESSEAKTPDPDARFPIIKPQRYRG